MVAKTVPILLLALLCIPGLAVSDGIPRDLLKLGKGQAYYLKFIKVYDATLYSETVEEGKSVLSSEVSKCLHIKYAVDIDQEDFVEAANTVLRRQFSQDQLALVSGDIELLHQGYQNVREGDSYTLCYNSAKAQTTLAFNGAEVTAVDSPDFAGVYFSIWLGERDPLDEKLRDNLLAGEGADEN